MSFFTRFYQRVLSASARFPRSDAILYFLPGEKLAAIWESAQAVKNRNSLRAKCPSVPLKKALKIAVQKVFQEIVRVANAKNDVNSLVGTCYI